MNNIGEYVISYGGKRIRPLIAILFGKILSCDIFKVISMASSIELIHTATLLHDDVVDLSEKRRGKITVNRLWGNKEAILVGDFLYTRAFQIMVGVNNLDILKMMSSTTNIMSEGEVDQLINRFNFDITKNACINIARCKTAQLFSAASSVASILSNSDDSVKNASYKYGLYLGLAYQLIDDMLDYSSNDIRFGKTIGEDILNSTFTLPLVHFMNSNINNKEIIKNLLIKKKNDNILFEIRSLVIKSDSIDYTYELALNYINLARQAILSIPESRYTQFALYLTDFIINRKY